MDEPYWWEHYLLNEVEKVAQKITMRMSSLGDYEWPVLNPLNWDVE